MRQTESFMVKNVNFNENKQTTPNKQTIKPSIKIFMELFQ